MQKQPEGVIYMDSMVVTYVTRVLKNAMCVIPDISLALLKEGSQRPVSPATWVLTIPMLNLMANQNMV
jgi:hypothetical protein